MRDTFRVSTWLLAKRRVEQIRSAALLFELLKIEVSRVKRLTQSSYILVSHPLLCNVT